MKSPIKKIVTYGLLVIFSIVVLFPFIWMILTSLKSAAEAIANPPVVFPSVPLFSNYPDALSIAPFGMYFINSVIVALVSTIFVLIINSLAAFAIAKYNFKGKKILIALLLATLMIPGEMLVITNYETISTMQLIDTRVAIFLPYLASVFFIFLLVQFYEQVPHELYLASKIDGGTDWQFFWKILLPISKPILITVGLLNVIASWNAFLWPLLVTNSDAVRTLPIGMSQFTSDAGTHFELQMAAATITILPMIILFIVSRKYVIDGLASGAVKK